MTTLQPTARTPRRLDTSTHSAHVGGSHRRTYSQVIQTRTTDKKTKSSRSPYMHQILRCQDEMIQGQQVNAGQEIRP